MMKKYLLAILALMLTVSGFAQFKPGTERPTPPSGNQPLTEQGVRPEGEKPKHEEFFDPTRKQEKKKEVYAFSMDWRVEAGYVQNQQRSLSGNMINPFLHGARIGATVDFNLPYHTSIQTGLLYTVTYGQIEQHWPATTQEAQHNDGDYIRHGIMEHQIGIPVRAFYNQHLWKKLAMFFYGGPKLEVGAVQRDFLKLHLTDTYDNIIGTKEMLENMGIHTEDYDRYQAGDLYRCNIQLGVGGGFEWDRYRIQAGYDFGLNNLVRHKYVEGQHMWEWGWYTSFSYRF